MRLKFRLSSQGKHFVRAVRRAAKVGREILTATWKLMRETQLLTVSASLAFMTILSIVPVLALSFAIFKAFGGLERLYDALEPVIVNNLAQGVSDQAVKQLHVFIDNIHASAVGITGLLGLILTSMGMLSNAEKAINQVWHSENQRNIFQRVSAYWLFVTLGPLFASGAIGFATSNNFPLASFFPSGTGMFGLTVLVFFFAYKWVPNTFVDPRCASISALLAAVLFQVAHTLYGLYVTLVVPMNRFYGSLGAIPIAMIWIQILWIIILAGAALTVVLQRRFR